MSTLKGTIVEAKTRRPLAKLKISAWDKDPDVSDQLGNAVSDERGRFVISFDDSRYMDSREDTLPDIFFIVYKENKVIYTTEERPLKGTGENIVIEVGMTETDTSPSLLVQGKVIETNTKAPISGLRVEAWDRDEKKSDFLGISTTSKDGIFTIRYEARQFMNESGEQLADIFFRVFTGDTCIHSTEDKPVRNPGQLYDVIIEIKSDPDEIRPRRKIGFVKDEIIALERVAGQKLQDLQQSNAALYNRLLQKAWHQLQNSLIDHFKDSSLEVKLFIRNLGEETIIPEPAENIRAFLSKIIRQSNLSAPAKREALTTAEKWDGVATLNELLQPDTPLKENTFFHKELAQGKMIKAGTMASLADTTIQKLIEKELTPQNINNDLLKVIVEEKILTDKEAGTLGLQVNILQLSMGDAQLAETLKNKVMAAQQPSLKELAAMHRSDWETIVAENTAELPAGATTKELAAFIHKQVEMLFPEDAFLSHRLPLQKEKLSKLYSTVQPLLANNNRLFDHITFENLDLSSIPESNHQTVQQDYDELNRIVNRYPGLHLSSVLSDKNKPADEKLKEVSRLVEMADNFYKQHRTTSFLSMDLSPDSEDIKQLSMGNYAEQDRQLLLNNLQMNQRMYSITQDSEHAYFLMEKGYHAAYQIASDSYQNFKQTTGLDAPVAYKYYQTSIDATKKLTANAGTIFDYIFGGLDSLHVGNIPMEVIPYLKRLNGFSTLFGNQNYCKCSHCQSIVSPAAYFVDLMDFIKKNVLNKHFKGADKNHILNPKIRRPDLWQSLELTCENTDTLIPYLIIINEILENYIATRPGSGFVGSITNRPAVENFVYKKLYQLPAIRSFRQPFFLPLAELETYLNHFPVTREYIAERVLLYVEDTNQLMPQAQFRVSPVEYNLIMDPNTNAGFLSNVYRMVFPAIGVISPKDVQKFLQKIDIPRAKFTELIDTRFITADGTQQVTILATTSPGGVQPDKEEIHSLTLAFLDRMHRFVRLTQHLDWTVQDLDLLLYHLRQSGIITNPAALPLPLLGRLWRLQKRLKLKMPELIALFHNIPVENDPSQFDILFNRPAFIRQSGEWDASTLSINFQHPAYRTDLPDTAGTAILHRLLAGLGMNDDDLFVLIENLKSPLASIADGSFILNLGSLSLLYRHARLARSLKITISELFSLMRLQPIVLGSLIDSIPKLRRIVELTDWWKTTKYSVDELAFIMGQPTSGAYISLAPGETAASIRDQVIIEQQLIFAATLFSYFPGITETQSRAIIDANATVIEKANIRRYRIAATVTDPATVSITIPPDITAILLPADQTILINSIREVISIHMQTGAPDIADHVLTGMVGLNRAQSQSILEANTAIFEAVENADLYWLKPSFDPNGAIIVPAGIPLSPEGAKGLLMSFYVGEIIPVHIGSRLSLASDKTKMLALLAGYDFSNAALGQALAEIIQGVTVSTTLKLVVAAVQKLGVWFKDAAFTADVLKFMQANSGGNEKIFQIADYNTPLIHHIEKITLFLGLLKNAKDKSAELFTVLNSFDYTTTHRFSQSTLESLSILLKAEQGIVTALNQVLTFPVTDPQTSVPSNRALEALDKFEKNTDLVQYLGIGGEALPLMLSGDYDALNHAVEALVAAIRTKYETEEEYEEKIGPFEDKIREQKRDALTDYFIHILDPAMFIRPNDLYHYFLIDTELEGCARTSRVVAGISSLQLYVQRCLLNLEQSQDGNIHVQPTDIPANEWEWRKNYRVWEANRKVFLWPENYIEPDLRDDKTPLFKELESELLQQDINAQTVQDAYGKYMKGFIEVASLKIAGAYHDKSGSRDVLHMFGITSAQPGEYYYRTVENIYESQKEDTSKGIVWGNWEKVNVQIPVGKVSPIVFRNKLYVFWVQYASKSKDQILEGTQIFSGYTHTMRVKFTSLNLDGTWTAPQQLSLHHDIFKDGMGVIPDLLVNDAERSWVEWAVEDTWDTMPGGLSKDRVVDMVIKGMSQALRDGPHVLNNEQNYSVKMEFGDFTGIIYPDFTSNEVRALFRPEYEYNSADIAYIHWEPRDTYTLHGYGWDRVYPGIRSSTKLSLTGRNFEMSTLVDLYELKAVKTSPGGVYISDALPQNRRLGFWDNKIKYGYVHIYTPGKQYPDAEQLFKLPFLSQLKTLINFTSTPAELDFTIINGTLTDGILNMNGDLLYLHCNTTTFQPYALKRLGTTISKKIGRRLFEKGIDGLLDVYYQEGSAKEEALPVSTNLFQLFKDTAKNIGKLDTKGSLGVYFREIFFQIPYLIANHLNSQGKYEDAQRWYHYIFNPTSDKLPLDYDTISDPVKKKKREIDRVWQFIEFRNHTLQSLKDQLNDKEAIYVYENDPFNPHAIARLRLGGYMKNIVMKYIDNLLDWGDQLFAQDTMESINEATMLYIMASEILGQRPEELGDCGEATASMTYNSIHQKMNTIPPENDFILGIESVTAATKKPVYVMDDKYMTDAMITVGAKAAEHVTTGGYFRSIYSDSMKMETEAEVMIVDTVTEPMAGAMPIAGAAPASGAASSGLSTDIGLMETAQAGYYMGNKWNFFNPGWNFPLYDFGTSLLQQAYVFCVPQNKDLLAYWDRVEDRLYKIRNCMNISGLKRQLALFAPEIDPRLLVRARAEGLSIQDVLNSMNGNLPPYRFSYLIMKAKEYTGMLQSFGAGLLTALEKKDSEEMNMLRLVQQENIMKASTKMRDQEIESSEFSLEALIKRKETIVQRSEHYAALSTTGLTAWEEGQSITKHIGNLMMPAIVTLFAVSGGAHLIPKVIGMANSTPGDSAAKSAEAFGAVARFVADSFLKISDSMALEANFERRAQGWEFQLAQTKSELVEMEKQIKAAEVRLEISRKSKELHELSIQQLEETYQYYQDKFSSLGLYTWLSGYLQKLYRAAYQDALAMAQLAERAYRFEKNDDTTPLLDGNYWDAGKSGLLAGDRLQSDLRSMERKYIETHYRTMEIDQAFSLMQIDPAALLQLKTTGECSYMIPEVYFDLFYPGQYRRRIKSARLTIPSVTGPFTNVSATLTLKESFIRKDPITGNENLLAVPPMRSVTIATSSGQNDSGIFRLDFRDERYMPFEGAGAVNSTWGLSLPKSFRPFDYSTINDVILHISYTAEFDGVFREKVEGNNGTVLGEIHSFLEDNSIFRMLSVRQEFSAGFHRLFHQALGTIVPFELNEKHFPLFLQGRELEITSAKLVLVIDESQLLDSMGTLLPSDLDVTITSNGGGEAAINSYMMDPDLKMPVANILSTIFASFNPSAGPLNMTMKINDAGVFTPADTAPGLPVVDNHKLKDIIILLEYKLA